MPICFRFYLTFSRPQSRTINGDPRVGNNRIAALIFNFAASNFSCECPKNAAKKWKAKC